MPDNKNDRETRDRLKADNKDPNEIAHLQNQFPGTDRNTIVDAVKQFGPGRDAVINFLKSKQTN